MKLAKRYRRAHQLEGLPTAWWIGGIGIILAIFGGLFFVKRKQVQEVVEEVMSVLGPIVDTGKLAAFTAALPSNIGRWSGYLLAAANQYGVSPWMLAGIMARESQGGDALTPPIAAGTGDFTPRGSTSRYFKWANPATGLPIDSSPEQPLGWGRGLMQIDFGVWNDWVTSNAWWDPQVNIGKSAEIVRDQTKQLAVTGLTGSDLAAAVLAAYNAGVGNVLKAIKAGQSPSSVTTGGEYADWVLTRVAGWTSQFTV